MRFLTIVAVCCLLVASASVARAQSSGFGAFRTGAGIGCAYDAKFLRCDIDGGVRPRPARPSGCGQRWGQGYEMGRKGPAAVVCASDSALAGPVAVPLATAWHAAGFLCAGDGATLRCNNSDGFGFVLSKNKSFRF